MAEYKLSRFNKIAPELHEGEQLVAGAFAMPPGGVKRVLGGSVGGAVGALAAGAGKGQAGSVELPRRFVLGLTSQRLLFCKPDQWLGKPKKVLYAIPLSDLASAESGKAGAMSQQAVFTTKSGDEIVVEAMKGKGRGWLENLIAKLRPLLST